MHAQLMSARLKELPYLPRPKRAISICWSVCHEAVLGWDVSKSPKLRSMRASDSGCQRPCTAPPSVHWHISLDLSQPCCSMALQTRYAVPVLLTSALKSQSRIQSASPRRCAVVDLSRDSAETIVKQTGWRAPSRVYFGLAPTRFGFPERCF